MLDGRNVSCAQRNASRKRLRERHTLGLQMLGRSMVVLGVPAGPMRLLMCSVSLIDMISQARIASPALSIIPPLGSLA